jgi:hypothetical protein
MLVAALEAAMVLAALAGLAIAAQDAGVCKASLMDDAFQFFRPHQSQPRGKGSPPAIVERVSNTPCGSVAHLGFSSSNGFSGGFGGMGSQGRRAAGS